MKRTIGTARIILFSIWTVAFVFYAAALLATSYKSGVSFEQASTAAWNVTYILLPIITAFASFWFTPGTTDSIRDQEVDPHRLYAMFLLTGVFHLIVFGYFAIAVFFVDFSAPINPNLSFTSRVDAGLKWLLLLSSLALLPVGYVLGGKAPTLAGPSTPGSTSQPAGPRTPD